MVALDAPWPVALGDVRRHDRGRDVPDPSASEEVIEVLQAPAELGHVALAGRPVVLQEILAAPSRTFRESRAAAGGASLSPIDTPVLSRTGRPST